VGLEKLRIEGEEFRVESFLDSRHIDFRVLRPGVVSMNKECPNREEQENQQFLTLQTGGSVEIRISQELEHDGVADVKRRDKP
jgi:hypothetical protein